MEPACIKKLDEAVINRIAAGEIIQRPANALKELLENSLDAKSSIIQITVKSGGLKQIQIQDNGTGIRKEDLAIVCERFTTSKLVKFEDLTNIATYGFRGEALASISHVAHLSIQTKTAQEVCGYKSCYQDGKLKTAPKPCAGNQGTIITIEDLFYNMPQRKQILKSPAEEFQKISDVVSKYAVHNSKVGFSLKKFQEQPTVKTSVNSSKEENIRLIFGSNISKELLPIAFEDHVHKFSLQGLITKVNYSAKKGIMLLFINNRLVESTALKAAVDAVYSSFLPKGMHPFIYMSLELEPTNVDVNVHPTKHEVHFLHEDEIIEKIKTTVETHLLGSNESRIFYKQLKLPGVSEETEQQQQQHKSPQIYAKDLIRTDAKEQKLDKFLLSQHSPVVGNATNSANSTFTTKANDVTTPTRNLNDESFQQTIAKKMKEVRLTSVLKMQQNIDKNINVHMRKIIKDLVFVGIIDRTFSLFQFETKLYLCNTKKFCEELFYERLVFEFQNFAQIKLEPPLSVKQLIRISLESQESGWTEDDGDKNDLAENATAILLEKAQIMREYFGLNITTDGNLTTLPVLLKNHCPSKTLLPIYMLRLTTEVEWKTEEECFETFCRETARFYAQISLLEYQTQTNKYKWMIEHIIYPAFKRFLLPPSKLKKQLYELTNLSTLYKVFERC